MTRTVLVKPDHAGTDIESPWSNEVLVDSRLSGILFSARCRHLVYRGTGCPAA
ncbi:hypothetical protein BaRGS_00005225, partial [Batillaria attramentaria]